MTAGNVPLRRSCRTVTELWWKSYAARLTGRSHEVSFPDSGCRSNMSCNFDLSRLPHLTSTTAAAGEGNRCPFFSGYNRCLDSQSIDLVRGLCHNLRAHDKKQPHRHLPGSLRKWQRSRRRRPVYSSQQARDELRMSVGQCQQLP